MQLARAVRLSATFAIPSDLYGTVTGQVAVVRTLSSCEWRAQLEHTLKAQAGQWGGSADTPARPDDMTDGAEPCQYSPAGRAL